MAKQTGDMTLEEVKEAIEKVRTEIAKRQGEREGIVKAIKSEFSVKNIDDAYKLLKKLNVDADDAGRERTSLMAQATTKLRELGVEGRDQR